MVEQQHYSDLIGKFEKGHSYSTINHEKIGRLYAMHEDHFISLRKERAERVAHTKKLNRQIDELNKAKKDLEVDNEKTD